MHTDSSVPLTSPTHCSPYLTSANKELVVGQKVEKAEVVKALLLDTLQLWEAWSHRQVRKSAIQAIKTNPHLHLNTAKIKIAQMY